MPEDPVRPPRSPLRVAVMTFGAVVLIGLIVGLTIMSITGGLDDSPEARGEKFGQGLTPLAVIAAVIAFFRQKKKLEGR